MAQLNWSEALSVGVGDLDEDHRVLLAVGDALRQALADRQPELAQAGSEVLVEACRAHFRREEEMLSACRFPGAQDHIMGHKVFLEALEQLRFDVDRRLWLPAQARHGEMVGLLHGRLLREDAGYARFLRREGLVPRYQDLAFTGWEREKRTA